MSELIDLASFRRAARERTRSARKRAVRKRTIPLTRVPQFVLDEAAATYVEADVLRPKVRGDCEGGERPCPFVACKWHLYLDVGKPRKGIREARNIALNFPDVEPEELAQLPATCALDVADEGGTTLERVAEMMNMTRERVRQIETMALEKVRRLPVLPER